MKNVRLPKGFQKYPNPLTDLPHDGWIDVDLGSWIINGKVETINMRVNVAELEEFLGKLAKKGGRSKRFGGGAFDVFVVAGCVRLGVT